MAWNASSRGRTRSYSMMLLPMVDIQPAPLSAPSPIWPMSCCLACFRVTTPSRFLTGVAELLQHEPLGAGKRLDVGPKIHGKLAGVGVGEVAALDVVADAIPFPDVEAEPRVHARSAQVVGQQHQRRPLGVTHTVPGRPDHRVHLVDGIL